MLNPRLKTVLIANAVSCLGFGALFVAAPGAVAGFVGGPPTWIVIALGVGLVFNGAHIIWVARQSTPRRRDVLYFAFGDALWVLGTLVLLLGGIWITTTESAVVALLIAIWVGGCGLLQWRYAPSS